MPPAPTGDTISYGPSLVPEVSAIDARNYSPYAWQRMRTDSARLVGNRKLKLLNATGGKTVQLVLNRHYTHYRIAQLNAR
jgi:hypothetical protein